MGTNNPAHGYLEFVVGSKVTSKHIPVPFSDNAMALVNPSKAKCQRERAIQVTDNL